MIGQSVPRRGALEKARGAAGFIADLHPRGAWHGVTIRSPVARGRIRRLACSASFPHDRAVWVNAAGLGERNRVAMIADDMPFLAAEEVRYLGEPVALVAAPSLAEARAAARHVILAIDPAPAVTSLAAAVAAWRRDPSLATVFARYRIRRGDAAAALRDARHAVTGTYTTPAAEQAYIEPQGVIAWPAADGGARIEGSLQCPYYIQPALARLLACDPAAVVVSQATTGGAFGGKEDFPTLIAGHAALLARACGRPVKLIYDRSEDLLFTTKRHPSLVRHETGLSADGRLTAMRIEVFLDGGAYTTLSPVVLARAVITAPGPYECPHVEVDGVCLATHTPPNGAFRGFGAPQVSFATEVHMDRLAERAGLPPDELRRRNLVRVGSVTATGQILRESVSAEKVLAAAVRASGFRAKWRRWHAAAATENPGGASSRAPRRRRGIGMALVWHGSGFTGGGEQRMASRAALTVEPDDRLLIRVSTVEMGQGTETVLPQIAAARLGIPLGRIACARPDTSQVPNSGPTVASRTVMIVGSLVADCAGQLAAALRDAVAAQQRIAPERIVWEQGMARTRAPRGSRRAASRVVADLDTALRALRETGGRLRFEAVYRVPAGLHWDEGEFRGDAYAVYGYACTIAEVEVDAATHEIRVPRIYAACDVGRAIHPVAAIGQIQGGVLQGLGYALLERLTLKDGRYEQGRFQTYLIPTSLDAPRIDALLVEEPYSGGPGGAKGLGEIPISGPAPAIANAVAGAIGQPVSDLPITPELLWARGRKSGAGEGV